MYRKKIMTVLISAMLITLTACGGKDAEEVIAVDVETTEEISEEIAEEINTEAEPTLSYVEENGLEFTDETKVSTQGILSMPDNTDADIIDVDLEIADINISINDDNTKTITIEQIIYGYIWSDGKNIFKTNLNLPSVILCDKNNGKIFSMTEENTTTQIEWGEEKFSIETIETESWEDGDWSSDWVDDPNGGERLPSTLKITDTIKVSKDYDGLALVLIPITSADNSILGSRIMDIWTDGSYLFSISDINAKLEQIKDMQIAESEEGEEEEEEIKQEEIKTAENSPKETTAPKEETKPTTTHTHNYNEVVTQGNCVTNGVKVYTCSCGDSYTESLGYGSHDFSTPIYESVFHDEVWQTVPRTIKVTIIHCSCGYSTTSEDEFQNHCVERINAGYLGCGMSDWYENKEDTVYDQVKVSDAYTSEEIVGYKCSVCGATQ